MLSFDKKKWKHNFFLCPIREEKIYDSLSSKFLCLFHNFINMIHAFNFKHTPSFTPKFGISMDTHRAHDNKDEKTKCSLRYPLHTRYGNQYKVESLGRYLSLSSYLYNNIDKKKLNFSLITEKKIISFA